MWGNFYGLSSPLRSFAFQDLPMFTETHFRQNMMNLDWQPGMTCLTTLRTQLEDCFVNEISRRVLFMVWVIECCLHLRLQCSLDKKLTNTRGLTQKLKRVWELNSVVSSIKYVDFIRWCSFASITQPTTYKCRVKNRIHRVKVRSAEWQTKSVE